jgi:hypothetical protein
MKITPPVSLSKPVPAGRTPREVEPLSGLPPVLSCPKCLAALYVTQGNDRPAFRCQCRART